MLRSTALRWVSSQALRYLLILGLDAVATGVALYAALFLRLDGRIASQFAAPAALALPILVCVRLLMIVFARLHRWSFRMSGISEATRLVVAMLAGSVLFL